MRGLPLWICLTEGKFGVFYWVGAVWVCVPGAEGAAVAVPLKWGVKWGDVNHLAHLP